MPLTVANVIEAIRDRLDERAPGQWTDEMLKRWLNEGLRDLGRKTKHIKDTATVATVAGQAEYVLPSNVIEVEMAYYAPGDGRQTPMIARTFDGMNAVWGSYRDQSGGDPLMFTTWGVPPQLKLRLFPPPGTSAKTITLYVTRLPATVTEDNTVDGVTLVDLPDAWVDLMKDFVEFSALRRDRDPRWQEAFNMYTQRVDDMVVNSDYMNTAQDMIADPMVRGGVVPRWLVDGGGW